MYRWLGSTVAAVVFVGCSSGGDGSGPKAICTSALHRHVASATATTVGEIRAWKIGPGGQPGKDAFGTLRDGAPGAWCSVPVENDGYRVYGAANGQVVSFATMHGVGVPHGGPLVP
jgi:hypothetical protein